MFSKDSKVPTAAITTNDATGGIAKSSGVPSIISPDLKVIGDLKSNGDIQIDGTIEGDINSRLLTVGERAKVEGCIVADNVRISGTVVGQVKAKMVHLDKTARVTGDVTHETLTMEAGAFLEGQVRRLEATGSNGSAKVAPLRPATSGNDQGAGYGEAESSTAQGQRP